MNRVLAALFDIYRALATEGFPPDCASYNYKSQRFKIDFTGVDISALDKAKMVAKAEYIRREHFNAE